MQELHSHCVEVWLGQLASLPDFEPDNWTPVEAEKVAALRGAVLRAQGLPSPPCTWHHHFYLRSSLLGFVRARQGDVDAAQSLMLSTMGWFEEVGYWDQIRRYATEDGAEQKRLLEAHMAQGVFGHDKRGAPVNYVRVGLIDMAGLIREVGYEMCVRGFLFKLEAQRSAHYEACLRQGRYLMGGSVVFDCAGMTISRGGAYVTFFTWLMQHYLNDHFPELTHIIFLVNSPWYLYLGWRFLGPMIPAATLQKIRIRNADYLSSMLESIDASQIPSFLDGESQDPWIHGTGGDVPQGERRETGPLLPPSSGAPVADSNGQRPLHCDPAASALLAGEPAACGAGHVGPSSSFDPHDREVVYDEAKGALGGLPGEPQGRRSRLLRRKEPTWLLHSACPAIAVLAARMLAVGLLHEPQASVGVALVLSTAGVSAAVSLTRFLLLQRCASPSCGCPRIDSGSAASKGGLESQLFGDAIRAWEREDQLLQSLLKEHSALGPFGRDKLGLPVSYARLGHIDMTGLLREAGHEACTRYCASVVAGSMDAHARACGEQGKSLPGSIHILDLAGIPLLQALACAAFLVHFADQVLSEVLHKSSPGLWRSVYAVNAPRSLRWALALLLAPESRGRVRIYGSDFLPALQEAIEVEQIPPWLGGLAAEAWPHGQGGEVPLGVGRCRDVGSQGGVFSPSRRGLLLLSSATWSTWEVWGWLLGRAAVAAAVVSSGAVATSSHAGAGDNCLRVRRAAAALALRLASYVVRLEALALAAYMAVSATAWWSSSITT